MPLLDDWQIVNLDGRPRIEGTVFNYSGIFEDDSMLVADGVRFTTSPIVEMAQLPEEDITLVMSYDNFYTLGSRR